MTLVVVWTRFVSIFVSEIMNSRVLICDRETCEVGWSKLSSPVRLLAGETARWERDSPGNFLKSNATSRVSSDQVLQFNRLQLSLMSLYSAWEAPGRYMICCWSTWEEVESRLLDWTINRLQQKPSPTSDADHHHYYHHHHQQHHHSYHHPSPTWDADQWPLPLSVQRCCRRMKPGFGSGRRSTFLRLSTRHRGNLSPGEKSRPQHDTLFCRIKDEGYTENSGRSRCKLQRSLGLDRFGF